jgi:hypothetical protein
MRLRECRIVIVCILDIGLAYAGRFILGNSDDKIPLLASSVS